jgi:hypothetical protein
MWGPLEIVAPNRRRESGCRHACQRSNEPATDAPNLCCAVCCFKSPRDPGHYPLRHLPGPLNGLAKSLDCEIDIWEESACKNLHPLVILVHPIAPLLPDRRNFDDRNLVAVDPVLAEHRRRSINSCLLNGSFRLLWVRRLLHLDCYPRGGLLNESHPVRPR